MCSMGVRWQADWQRLEPLAGLYQISNVKSGELVSL